MRQAVGKIEKKRSRLILVDESQRLFSVTLRDRGLICGALDDLLVAHDRHVPVLDLRLEELLAMLRRARDRVHVVRVRDAVVGVEPVVRGEELWQVPEVPLADASGGVALRLERLREGDLASGQAAGRVGEENSSSVAAHTVSNRQTAGHERGTTRGADAAGGVELCQLHAFCRHAIEVRRADSRVAETGEIAVAEVVGEDDDEFKPTELVTDATELPAFEALFFGTYVPLHGIEVIVDAADLLLQEKDINITVIGTGQLLPQIKQDAERRAVTNIDFIDRWVPTDELVAHIERAQVCLGIFGSTPKAARVIPYKVYDALAMRKPVVTRDSPAVRELLVNDESALLCAPEGKSLADALLRLRNESGLASKLACNGYERYRQHGSPAAVGRALVNSLKAAAA